MIHELCPQEMELSPSTIQLWRNQPPQDPQGLIVKGSRLFYWRQRDDIFGVSIEGDLDESPALLADLWARLQPKNVRACEARAFEYDTALRALLEAHSFEPMNALYRMRLELSHTPEITIPEGVTITTLQQELSDTSLMPKLYEALNDAFTERPTRFLFEDDGKPSLEVFSRMTLSGLLDGYFIAKHQGEIAGVSALKVDPDDPSALRSLVTATPHKYRGKGFAVLLKHIATRYAIEHGFTAITTTTPNPAMKILNEKLGFTLYKPTELRLARFLQQPS
jgi:GNAT superfamily N-acetyltransferase